jgi:glutamyl/glutaminyl-tRNA synthetase
MQLLRVLVTGVAGGPQLFDMLALMGKEEVLQRLGQALGTH